MLSLYVGTFVLIFSAGVPAAEIKSSKFCESVGPEGENVCDTIIEEKALGTGVLSYFPYGISQVLQVLKDRPWDDVTADSFANWKLPLLASRKEKFLYEAVTNNFLEDPAVNSTRTLYAFSSIANSDTLEKQKVDIVRFGADPTLETLWNGVNNRTDSLTRGIHPSVIPAGGWFGTPFHPNYTKGVIVDTFYYRAAVSTNLKDTAKDKPKVGEKSLQWLTVNATMTTSSKDGQIFVVPLKESTKKLVFVVPSENITKILKDFERRPLELDIVNGTEVVLVMPPINFTTFENQIVSMERLGFSKFCKLNSSLSASAPFQNIFVRLDSNGIFELAITTDVQVDDERARRKFYGLDEDTAETESPVSAIITNPTPAVKHPSERHRRAVKSPPSKKGVISFDKPFLMYLYEDKLGPLFVSLVSSIETYYAEHEKVEEVDESLDFLKDLPRFQQRDCGHWNEHFLDS